MYCAIFGGKSERARQTSRFWGTKLLRVDEMPYKHKEETLHGHHMHGVFRGDAHMRGEEMVSASTNDAEAAHLTFSLLTGHRRPGAGHGSFRY